MNITAGCDCEPKKMKPISIIGGQGAIRRRLMDMGVVHGVEIELVKAAPLGDPLEYRLRGYHLSLRKAEAQFIEIDAASERDLHDGE